MKILILGGNGMLGHKLFQRLAQNSDVYVTFRGAPSTWNDHPVYCAADQHHMIGHVDAMQFDGIIRVFGQVKPDVVINCIGIVKQLHEANDPIICLSVNALLPHRLADLCNATGARLVHISTDCVFSGRKGGYSETDIPDAEDLYGRSKLLGELDRPGCLTIRTSIIGRDFRKSYGLLEWFLGQRGRQVRGYTNAIYSGFPTLILARIIDEILHNYPELAGLYQVASEPISKYDLLVKIRDAMKLNIAIDPCETPRCDRSMSPARFIAATSYRIPSWDEMIDELVTDPTPYDTGRTFYAAA